MGRFKVKSDYRPQGDQPQAIDKLAASIIEGNRDQVLIGVTGSGKTFTMANVIERVQKPTLVIAHNKTLAAQLCSEFKEFFPDSAVEFFVSYYDYYQPEAYIPSADIYIEKTATINDEIDKLRHSATSALQERRDVIIVASVSCIYALGDPKEYLDLSVSLRPGMERDRDEVLRQLVDIQYERSDIDFVRGTFRVRGDVIDIFPASTSEKAVRVDFFGDEIESISEINVVTGEAEAQLDHIAVFPATHYAASKEKIQAAMADIERDLEIAVKKFTDAGQLLEAQRIEQRTRYDMEMMQEMGYCPGVENYSRYFDGRKPGEPPYTLLDYFPEDFLIMIDESHVTLPQIRAMYAGDYSRKDSLVQYGFRLPSAYDNRPLKFDEFNERANQILYVSATPAKYEKERADVFAEQIIRPTGLVDPIITVKPAKGQVDDLMAEIRDVTEKGWRVLVTTLTKKMAENLTDYLAAADIRVRYMHSDIETIERMEIVRDLRTGEFDVLVGINLLREGLDLPEVALVAILDADKEGFLRSETSLIQTVGRAARNVEGRVIMYADNITDSMARAMGETERRREKQMLYNKENNITPRSVEKAVRGLIEITRRPEGETLPPEELGKKMQIIEAQMRQAALELDFETAAKLRDTLFTLQGKKPDKKGTRGFAGKKRRFKR
ncbi:MAG: excinuclease ABC subunit UvrB [Christensenellales bacterium]|jgi:excinuclease ABC subunit B